MRRNAIPLALTIQFTSDSDMEVEFKAKRIFTQKRLRSARQPLMFRMPRLMKCNGATRATCLVKLDIVTRMSKNPRRSTRKPNLKQVTAEHIRRFVPGIGKTLSEAIVAFARQQPFGTMRRVLAIPDIGDKRLASMEKYYDVRPVRGRD